MSTSARRNGLRTDGVASRARASAGLVAALAFAVLLIASLVVYLSAHDEQQVFVPLQRSRAAETNSARAMPASELSDSSERPSVTEGSPQAETRVVSSVHAVDARPALDPRLPPMLGDLAESPATSVAAEPVTDARSDGSKSKKAVRGEKRKMN